VSAPLEPGQEVEVLLSGPGAPKALKRLAVVAWAVLQADKRYCVGVHFDKALRYAELLRFTRNG
jgi:hypothetical protein